MLVNIIDLGMGLQQAIDAPRYRYMSGRAVLLEDEIPATVIDRLIALGYLRAYTSRHTEIIDGRRPGNHD